MARVATMTAATAAMLLLAVVVASAAAVDDRTAPASGRIAGHHNRISSEDSDGRNSPLTELALCVSTCGSNVAHSIMTQCYEPVAGGKGDPVMVTLCLNGCATELMSCATNCRNNFTN